MLALALGETFGSVPSEVLASGGLKSVDRVSPKKGHQSPGGASWAMASVGAPRGHSLRLGPAPRVGVAIRDRGCFPSKLRHDAVHEHARTGRSSRPTDVTATAERVSVCSGRNPPRVST